MSIDFSPEHIADMAPDYITAKAELERENARLRGVLDRLRKATELVNDALYTMTQERDAAQARAERLAEALKPFADFAEAWDTGGTIRNRTGKLIPITGGIDTPDNNVIARARTGNIEPDVFVVLGDFRHARKVRHDKQ